MYSMLPIIQALLSNFALTFRKHWSANHVLVNLIHNLKNNLDNYEIASAVFMNLSKASDCISYSLLIVRREVYVFSEDFTTFSYSYVKR